MGFLKKFTKQEISWMMYDWANSAHSVIVVTILPIFFDSVASCTADSVSSMSIWGYATSIAMAIVALAAPFLGVFGDIRGMRKKLFTAFLLLGVVSVAGLAFTPLMDFTSSTAVAGKVAMLVLVLYILSTIGFDASCIYYDAFLTDVTTEDRMDSVSTLGYGLGYIGGSTIPLLIFLIMNAVGVPMLTSLAIIFAITAVWWLVFSLPLLKNCEQTTGKPYEKGDIGASIKNVFTTMKGSARISPCWCTYCRTFSTSTACIPSSACPQATAPTWGWIPPVCCWLCCWCRCWACLSACCT